MSALAKRLRLPKTEIESVVNFLLKTGLCKHENGKLTIGPNHMHLEAHSPMIRSHHANWCLRAMERHPFLDQKNELAYSLAVCLSMADAESIRSRLLQFVKDTRKITDPSPSEDLYCMNLDWFRV